MSFSRIEVKEEKYLILANEASDALNKEQINFKIY